MIMRGLEHLIRGGSLWRLYVYVYVLSTFGFCRRYVRSSSALSPLEFASRCTVPELYCLETSLESGPRVCQSWRVWCVECAVAYGFTVGFLGGSWLSRVCQPER